MEEVKSRLTGPLAGQRRAEAIFHEHRQAIFRRTDRLFARLLVFQWLGSLLVALLVSPHAWAAGKHEVRPYIWAAIFLGAAVVSLSVAPAVFRPGRRITRHVVATGQMLLGALLIHLTERHQRHP